jgi:hypothetical protein
MRLIIVKYAGECAECGHELEIGQQAEYEKTTGIFCVGHFPTDVEKIREFRQAKADRRADKYEEWAEKRESKATAQLNSYPEIRHDWAFITQPGHIPFRARMNRADERAHDSLTVAEGFRNKAENIRHVRVKGDAARRDEIKRAEVDSWIQSGMVVDTCHFGQLEVVKVNKKTVTLKGKFSGNFTHDKIFISPINTGALTT